MTEVIVRPRADEKYDLYAHDSDNGNLIVSSDQGYENAADAEEQSRKLFSCGDTERVRHMRAFLGPVLAFDALTEADWRAFVAMLNDPKYDATPTHLTVEYRDGRVKRERLR